MKSVTDTRVVGIGDENEEGPFTPTNTPRPREKATTDSNLLCRALKHEPAFSMPVMLLPA